jgi:cobalt transporter subunit CbtB
MTTSVKSHVSTHINARTIAMIMFVLGAGLVFLTGFASSTTLHNAAHDSRHSMSFPCH